MKKLIAVAVVAGLMAGQAVASEYNKPGFITHVEDGRLWVFKEGSDNLKEFEKTGEPAKQYTVIGEGPNGMTVKAADLEVLNAYLQLIK